MRGSLPVCAGDWPALASQEDLPPFLCVTRMTLLWVWVDTSKLRPQPWRNLLSFCTEHAHCPPLPMWPQLVIGDEFTRHPPGTHPTPARYTPATRPVHTRHPAQIHGLVSAEEGCTSYIIGRCTPLLLLFPQCHSFLFLYSIFFVLNNITK